MSGKNQAVANFIIFLVVEIFVEPSGSPTQQPGIRITCPFAKWRK